MTGQAVGERIGAGRVARRPRRRRRSTTVQAGDVLVAERTDPDWEPVMRRVRAIVTDKGGRTAHAAIVSREFGLPCIVGTGTATSGHPDGDEVTVCCAEGAEGTSIRARVPFTVERIDAPRMPATRHQGHAHRRRSRPGVRALGSIPNAGVGLARTEFIITNAHRDPSDGAGALSGADRSGGGRRDRGADRRRKLPDEFFVRRFSEGVARIAAAFYPKPVIVRTSDFKTNEYAPLLGGREFEPTEENPMLGFRGASRYYDPRYADGFALECAGAAARAPRIWGCQRQGHDSVLPDGRRGPSRARGDGGQRAASGRGRPRGLRHVRDPGERRSSPRSSCASSTASRSARTI